MGRWTKETTSLRSLQIANSDSGSTKAWEHRDGVVPEKTLRGVIKMSATLADELFEHIRTVDDPDRYALQLVLCCDQAHLLRSL